MKHELGHFRIGESIGGNQDWLVDPMMKLGGCGAVTACDTCIWLARQEGQKGLYPFDSAELTKQDYIRFTRIMKPYLRPRPGGISKLSLYMDGFQAYLTDCRTKSFYSTLYPGKRLAFGCRVWKKEEAENFVQTECVCPDASSQKKLVMEGFDGSRPAEEAWKAVVNRIDAGFPVPMLVLRHQDPKMEDYIWHWFLLCGYDDDTEEEEAAAEGSRSVRKVQTVTYGEDAWVDFEGLWNTGHEEKGGLVIYSWE